MSDPYVPLPAAILAFIERIAAHAPQYDPNGHGDGRPFYGAIRGLNSQDIDDARALAARVRAAAGYRVKSKAS